MPHKSFAQPSVTKQEAISFELSGELVTDEPLEAEQPTPTWTEKFTALPTAPAGVTADFISCYILDSQGRRIYQADAMVNYLRSALVPEDSPRFEALIHDPTRLVSAALLGEIVEWLAPQQSGFPT